MVVGLLPVVVVDPSGLVVVVVELLDPLPGAVVVALVAPGEVVELLELSTVVVGAAVVAAVVATVGATVVATIVVVELVVVVAGTPLVNSERSA